jgi:hypothetical protein
VCKQWVEPAIRAAVPKALSGIHFSKLTLGTAPLRFEKCEVCALAQQRTRDMCENGACENGVHSNARIQLHRTWPNICSRWQQSTVTPRVGFDGREASACAVRWQVRTHADMKDRAEMYITLVYDGDSDIELGGIFGGSVGIKSLQVQLQLLKQRTPWLPQSPPPLPAVGFPLPCPAVRHSCLPSLRL